MSLQELDAAFLGNIESALKERLQTVSGIPADSRWALENRAYDPTGKDPWLRWTFRPQQGRRASLGTPGQLIRQSGVVMIELFTQQNTGLQASQQLASAIMLAMLSEPMPRYNNQGVLVRSCFPSGGGNVAAPWYMRPITVSWTADAVTP